MNTRHSVPLTPVLLLTLGLGAAAAQQAHVNLDWNPQKNTQDLRPYGANVISPDVADGGMVTFRLRAPDAQTVALSSSTIAAGLGNAGREAVAVHEGRRRLVVADHRAGPAEHLHLQGGDRRRRGARPEQYADRFCRSARLQPARRARRRSRVLRREERAARHRDAPRLPFHRDERRARDVRLHAARLQPHQEVPGSVPARRQRRAGLDVVARRPRGLHCGQPDCREEGRPDDHRDAEQPGGAPQRPEAHRADVHDVREGTAGAHRPARRLGLQHAGDPEGAGDRRAVDGRTSRAARRDSSASICSGRSAS